MPYGCIPLPTVHQRYLGALLWRNDSRNVAERGGTVGNGVPDRSGHQRQFILPGHLQGCQRDGRRHLHILEQPGWENQEAKRVGDGQRPPCLARSSWKSIAPGRPLCQGDGEWAHPKQHPRRCCTDVLRHHAGHRLRDATHHRGHERRRV